MKRKRVSDFQLVTEFRNIGMQAMTMREKIAEIIHEHGDFRTDADDVAAAILAILPVMAWQPIETASRDGTEVIACYCRRYDFQDAPTVYGPWTVAFRGGKWMVSHDGRNVIESEGYWGTSYMECEIDPTHWMPLPPPPADMKEEGQ